MVTVGKVVHLLELLVDDADAGLVGAVGDLLDVLGGLAEGGQLLVDDLGGLDGGLGVELGGVGDLEEDVLHDVAAVGALELELLALEEDVVEAPAGSGENGGDTTLALLDLEDEVDGALASVTGGPRLAGHGVGGVTVGTQTLAIDPGLGDGVGGLLLGEAEHLGDDGGGGDLDEDNVVETDLVVGVLEGEDTLDLVGLDHGLEDILDLEDLAVADVAAGAVGAGDPVGDGEDTADVVGGMTPLGGQPAVIVIQPADHGTDVEGTVDGVQLVGGTRDAGTVGDDGAVHDGAEQLGALLELEGFQTTAEGVEEDQTSGVKLSIIRFFFFFFFYLSFYPILENQLAGKGETHRQIRVHLVLVNIVGHILDLRIIGPVGRSRRGSRLKSRHGRETRDLRGLTGESQGGAGDGRSRRKAGDGDRAGRRQQSAGRPVGQPSQRGTRSRHDKEKEVRNTQRKTERRGEKLR